MNTETTDIESLDFYKKMYVEYVEACVNCVCRELESLNDTSKRIFENAKTHRKLRAEVRYYSDSLNEIGERICRIANTYDTLYVTRRLDRHIEQEPEMK